MKTSELERLLPFASNRQQDYLLALHQAAGNKAEAARQLGIDRRVLGRGVDRVRKKAAAAGQIIDTPPNRAKVLLLDIETAPMLANVWRLWDKLYNMDAVLEDWHVMSLAWMWDGEEVDDIKVVSQRDMAGYTPGTEQDAGLLEIAWNLLDEADVVVGHNLDRFDLKKLKARMVQNGITTRPSPFKQVDTLKIAKREFAFTSNRLDYLANALLGTQKIPTGGMKLWQDCKAGDEDAWTAMEIYNAYDVELLQGVYHKLRGWDKSHPNLSIMSGNLDVCGVCQEGTLVETEQMYHTNVSSFRVYRCDACGAVHRGRSNLRATHDVRVTKVISR